MGLYYFMTLYTKVGMLIVETGRDPIVPTYKHNIDDRHASNMVHTARTISTTTRSKYITVIIVEANESRPSH